MWQKFITVVLVLLTCWSVSVTNCQSDIFQYMDKKAETRYCGDNLVSVMQLVCNGTYNGFNTGRPTANYDHKKSLSEIEDDFWQRYEAEQQEEPSLFPFHSRPRAHRILKRSHYYRRGIVYECCILKGCSHHELYSYCDLPRK